MPITTLYHFFRDITSRYYFNYIQFKLASPLSFLSFHHQHLRLNIYSSNTTIHKLHHTVAATLSSKSSHHKRFQFSLKLINIHHFIYKSTSYNLFITTEYSNYVSALTSTARSLETISRFYIPSPNYFKTLISTGN